MLPAIGLIPIWFAHGRFWLMGENDWVNTDDQLASRGMPGILVFHALLWWWESPRKDRPVPEVAMGLWGVYILHLLFQVFYVNPANSTEDDAAKEEAWSVATKYFPSTITTTISSRISLGMAVDVWLIMGATLFVSYWSPDEGHLLANTTLLIRQRMTQSIKPAMVGTPLWFILGHLTLGSGCQGWDSTITALFLQALVTVLPFHILLWQREKERTNQEQPFPGHMAVALLVYYALQIICQFFIHDKNIVEYYLHMPPKLVASAAWTIKTLILVNMAIILRMSYDRDQEEEDATAVGTNVLNGNNATGAAGTPDSNTPSQPVASAPTGNNDANSAVEPTTEEQLRQPLLEADRDAAETAAAEVPTATEEV
ncbi:expressed unknown protein [Seminavis robusta]|uniref:Uncharacterized protein n=1 Tax=Seminavis robusta TaxID=568900 RepID=A0A9N8EBP9_9STRA|nr:expressed unknown protein [Seminavis robusta]|eukprot:Sro726_g193460.1 n/a (370) ;mRNA; f:24242-25351